MPAPRSSSQPERERAAVAPQAASPEADGFDLAARRELSMRAPAVLERFFDAFFPQVHGFARRMVRDQHAAEDLTQDIFLRLHRAFPRYDATKPLRPWVFAIASNAIRDHQRSQTRRRTSSSAFDAQDFEHTPTSDATPARAFDSSEIGAEVARAVGELPEPLRETFLLRYFGELSFADVGRALEITDVAARQRYSRALRELREHLGRGGYESEATT